MACFLLLKSISDSPTSYSVVLETMKQSQRTAEELNEIYMQVTYDLAVAKMVSQIQCTYSPRFENLFINFGWFHVILVFHKDLFECGITTILITSESEGNKIINARYFILYCT